MQPRARTSILLSPILALALFGCGDSAGEGGGDTSSGDGDGDGDGDMGESDTSSDGVGETVGDGDGDTTGDGDGDTTGDACGTEWAEKDGVTESIMTTWGAPCMQDADCQALLGDDAICITDIIGVFALPGGYCNKACSLPDAQTTFVLDSVECDPEGGIACIGAQDLFTACAPPCESSSQCGREGYGCQPMPIIAGEGDPSFCLMNTEDCCLAAEGCD
ncbi:hypothetical protein DB30_02193 [Enhygromyxa salina]|uniref:Endo-1,4-beta-xylanase A n=1 Tax=Enhygromyxa salina TaxID=215803 RepID=A0A0C2A3L6_9BACT|nr:hypothetical protein [Enhygromyxa salina]KIG17978.1 hypothetical protein DB30_02193 [Enhygromyxa salina]